MEEMFCTLDDNGNIKYISSSMQQKFGASDYKEGTNVEQLIHPDDYLPTREQFVKTIEEIVGFEAKIRLKHPVKKWIYTAIKAYPLIDDEGKVETILIYTNLTSSQESADDLSINSPIQYENVRIVMWSLDLKGGKHSVIGDVEGMFGIPEREFKTNPFVYKKLIHPEDHIQTNEMEKSVSLGQPALFEFRTIHPNGEIKCIQTKVIPITDLFGNIIRVDGVSIDITNQKKKIEKGADSTNNQFMVVLNKEGMITSVSPFPKELPDELKSLWMKKSIFSLLSERQTRKLSEYFNEQTSLEGRLFQTSLASENGLIYKVEVTVFPLFNHDQVTNILCHVRYQDIYRKTKKRLQANEKAIQKMLSETTVGLWHLNLETKTIIVTKGIETISGFRAKEFIQEPKLWLKRVHPQDQAIINKSQLSIIKGIPMKQEYRMITKTGASKWIEERVLPAIDSNGEITFLEGIVIDITQRRKKKQLQYSEIFSSLMEKSSLMMATFNINGEITSVNTAAQEITGYTEDELLSMTFLDLLPEDMQSSISDFMACSISLGLEISNKIVTMVHKNRQPLTLSIHALPLFNHGTMSGLYVMAKDFSKELKLEETLLKTKQTFYEKCNSIPFCIFILEINRESGAAKILEANEFAYKTLNYTQDEILNQPFSDIIFSKNFRLDAFIKDRAEYLHIRSVFLAKDGKKQPVFLYSHLTEWEGKEIILAIARPIQNEGNEQAFEKNDAGRQLRVLMAEMDINTMELANLTGLTTATISNLRTGKVKKPNMETAEKLAAALGVNLSYLWPDLLY